MAITKDRKREILAKITVVLDEASSVAFAGFSKLTVADAAKMRKALAENGVHYFVAKKTLLKRALDAKHYAGQTPDLPGEIALAWTVGADDTTAPARNVYTHGLKLKGAMTLLGGIFEDTFTDREQMTAIATIPPLPMLRGMFVNVINSSIQGLVTVLEKIREQKVAI